MLNRLLSSEALTIIVSIVSVDGPISLHSIIFNATMMALITASIPVYTMAASCNAALLLCSGNDNNSIGTMATKSRGEEIIVDTTFIEETSGSAAAIMTVVSGMHMNNNGNVHTGASMIYSSYCEGRVSNVDMYQEFLEVAVEGCRCLLLYMSDVLGKWTRKKAISCDVIRSEVRL